MKFWDLKIGDRFRWAGGMEYRKINKNEARCIEIGIYFGDVVLMDAEDEVEYIIATEFE